MDRVQQSTVATLAETDPSQFKEEYVEKRLEATRHVAFTVAELVSEQGLLTPIEAARTIAAAVSYGIWGLDEFVATGSLGPSIAMPEILASRAGVSTG